MFTDCSKALSVRLDTHVPELQQIAAAFNDALRSNFESVQVSIDQCPDLSADPFNLSSSGFGKGLVIAEAGGPGNLFPTINKYKAFDVREVCATCDQAKAFAFGPGAGPWPEVGRNCEMVANVNCALNSAATRTAKLEGDTFKLQEVNTPTFSLMANLAVSEPDTRPNLVHIKAKKRIGPTNFPDSLRHAIVAAFPEQLVSLAGIFVLHSGKAKVHVMPDFPACFHTEKEIDDWLRYFEVSSPLVCTTVMHSTDGNHKLRLEHTHCYSAHGDGGHYHYDTTPDEVEYEGWFAPASAVYRIDEV